MKNERMFDELENLLGRMETSSEGLYRFNRLAENDEDEAFEIAKEFLKKEDYQKALLLFSQLSSHFPKNPEYLTWFARSMYESWNGREDQIAKKALRLDDNNPWAHLIVGRSHFPVEKGKALEEYNKAIEQDPNLGEAYLLRAMFYHNTKQLEKASADLKKVVEIGPETPIAYLTLAMTNLELENGEEFFENYGKFEKFLPSQDRSTYLKDQKTRDYFNKTLEKFAFYKLVRPSLLDWGLKGHFGYQLDNLAEKLQGQEYVPVIVVQSFLSTINYSNQLDPL